MDIVKRNKKAALKDLRDVNRILKRVEEKKEKSDIWKSLLKGLLV